MSEIGNIIKVFNPMQQDYQYELVEHEGKNFADGFNPHFTPKEMLSMGVFEGKYLNSCTEEYPSHWFETAILSDKPNPSINYFTSHCKCATHRGCTISMRFDPSWLTV